MTARVAAHLIVGDREEPFLPALLESISTAAQTLIVNDNGKGNSPHSGIFETSPFAGRTVIDRSPFTDFATARNICLRLHGEHDAGDWVLFVDADEVHGDVLRRIASNLGRVPERADFVDGYTWHFFQSFDWYTSIERRMCFFRFSRAARWERVVHEQLRGLRGARLVLPYVYAHYGHVLPAKRHALKGRQYSALGWPGAVVDEGQVDALDAESYFAAFWPRLLRFTGRHPGAAAASIRSMRAELAIQFHQTDALVRKHQPLAARLRNAVMKLNYEQRWRSRAFNRAALRLLRQR